MKGFFVLSFCLAFVAAAPIVDFHKVQPNFVKMTPGNVVTSALTPLVAAKPQPKPESGILCEVCKLIVGFVESDLAKNSTVQQITNFLDTKVCTLFPHFLRAECNATVDKYAPELAQYIEQDLPAPVVCAKVGLCSGSLLAKLVAPVVVTTPLTPLVFKEQPKPESGILCEVCKLIVGFVESELGNNKTVAKIEKFLEDDVCKFFPSFLRPECNSTVAEYAPILAHYIEQKLPAAVVCAKTGLCSSSEDTKEEEEVLTPLVALRPAQEVITPLTPLVFEAPRPENGIVCEVCKLIVGFVESELGNNKTIAKIEAFLEDDVCKFFPSFLRPECNSTVAEYAPILAKYIDQKLPAAVVCAKTGLCSSSEDAEQVEQEDSDDEDEDDEDVEDDEEEYDLAELLKNRVPISQFQAEEDRR